MNEEEEEEEEQKEEEVAVVATMTHVIMGWSGKHHLKLMF